MTTLSRCLSVFAITVMAIAVPLSVSAQTASLSMVVTEGSVTVTGVTPGNEVVLFSCAKRTRDGGNYLETLGRTLSDTDKDGVVTLLSPVPLRSVWVAIDQQSGAVSTGTRPELSVRVSPIAPSMFRKDATEEIASLENRIPRLVLLLVRPNQGAWTLRGRDGADGDRDQEANGRLIVAFEDARPVVAGKEKAPKHLKHGDVVVAIDPGQLDIFLGQVTK